jgi:hypothetical protein
MRFISSFLNKKTSREGTLSEIKLCNTSYFLSRALNFETAGPVAKIDSSLEPIMKFRLPKLVKHTVWHFKCQKGERINA